MKIFKDFVIILSIFFITAGGVFAQELGVEASSSGTGAEQISGTSAGNVTMDFKDADITNVLRILSYKSGINIVAGKDVTGPITIRLTDVAWQKALDVILRTYGYTYEREGNIIRVTTTENLENEELVTEVFSLNYADAKGIPAVIEEMLSSRGSVKFDERANLVIVTDIPTNTYKIKRVIERLDVRTPQVRIDAKIIETTLGDDEKLGIDWTMKVAVSGPKRPTTFPFTDSIKTSGTKWFPKVMTPADIREYTKTTYDDVGNVISTETEQKLWYTLGSGFPAVDAGEFVFGTLDLSQFQAVLELLKSRSNTRIVSNPRIVTLNNQEAKIMVGTKIPIAAYTQDSSTGLWQITGRAEDQEVGITLKVTPHVNPEGNIVVDLHPEISSIVSWTGPDNAWAVTSTREAITQVMVKNGDTIGIGGLIKENTIDIEKKVPLLGDIPLIGLLFKKKQKTVEKTDLLIFVTVNIVELEPTATATVK